jgi:hypothetical protein
MSHDSRSSWRNLTALALIGLLGACQSAPPTITPGAGDAAAPTAQGAAAQGTPHPLSIQVLNSGLALGLERFAFLLKDENGSPVRDGAATVKFSRIVAATGQEVKAADGEAIYFGQGMPDGGSWVAYTEFDSSGSWALEVNLVRSDGWSGALKTQVEVQGKSDAPRAGMLAPAAELPRLASGGDLKALSSDEKPVEALYTSSLADAKTAKQPAVVLFASPAHCPTPMCKATLDGMKVVQAQLGSRARFIHVESRDAEDPTQMSAAAKAWGLSTDPWVFILDARGNVVARAEGGIDNTEMDLLTRMALGEQVTKPQQ